MKPFLRLLIIVLALAPFASFAQQADITGLWKGTMYNDTTQKFYRYEVGISKEKNGYSGFSHTWFIIGDTQYFGVKKVKVSIAKDGKILIEDNGLIAHNYPIEPNKGVRQLNVLSLTTDSIMILEGPFSTNRTKEYHPLTGSIHLVRKNDFWQSSLVPHLQELSKETDLSFVREENEAIEKEKASIAKLQSQEVKAQQQALAKIEREQKDQLKKAEEESRKLQVEQVAKEKTIAKAAAKEEKEELAKVKKEQKEQLKKAAQESRQIKAEQSAKQNTIAKEVVKEKVKEPKPETAKAPAAEIAKRTTVVQQRVNFTSDSLQLSLYDNGEVDGDTVSVVMNGQLIFSSQGLSTSAAKKTIYIPKEANEVELIMYAESLGSIPPNTGLLVVKDGTQLYELRFSGDYQKNASIIFTRKKE
ncbi:MAG TPA: hypothetical protein PKU77_06985 [Ferruginibacter sp.]|nr:hypothetical protein [Ferruginibacter sp.]